MNEININNSFLKQKSLNSDLINLRDDFDNFRITIDPKIFNSLKDNSIIKNSSKTFTNFPRKFNFKTKHNNLLINKNIDENKNYNISFKLEEKIPKSPSMINFNITKIKKILEINEKNLYKTSLNTIKKLSKSKTEKNFFSPNNSFNNPKNIFSEFKKINDVSKLSNNNSNKSKEKAFNRTGFINHSKNSAIYFNTSLDNFYTKNRSEIFKSITPINKSKYSIFSPHSHSVNFINDIINIYNKKSDNKEKIDFSLTKENQKQINNDIKNSKIDDDSLIYKILGIDSFNQISLKNLFLKNTAKVKTGILDELLVDKKLKGNNTLLHPFSNSYGDVLNKLSEKVGFIKNSINIIYPKITQKRYQIRNLERKKKYNLKKGSLQNIYENQNNEINNNNIYNKIFNFKNKKIVQSIITKYPLTIKNTQKGGISSKMYSFKGTNEFLNKRINKSFNILI